MIDLNQGTPFVVISYDFNVNLSHLECTLTVQWF